MKLQLHTSKELVHMLGVILALIGIVGSTGTRATEHGPRRLRIVCQCGCAITALHR